MKITKSVVEENSVVVEWNNGIVFHFNLNNLNDEPVVIGEADVRMNIVSRTSAQTALNGCEVL